MCARIERLNTYVKIEISFVNYFLKKSNQNIKTVIRETTTNKPFCFDHRITRHRQRIGRGEHKSSRCLVRQRHSIGAVFLTGRAMFISRCECDRLRKHVALYSHNKHSKEVKRKRIKKWSDCPENFIFLFDWLGVIS